MGDSVDESVGKSMRGWMREFMAVDVL